MGLFEIDYKKIIAGSLFLCSTVAVSLVAAEPTDFPVHIFYLIHTKKFDKALEHYQDYFDRFGRHDTEFLQQFGLSILEQGAKSYDPEIQLMTLFGAGIAMNEKALPILIRGIEVSHPQLQLIALSSLARSQNDAADSCLLSALRSNNLLVRLEAAHQIALKKHRQATHFVESLMGKVDDELLPLFPQLFAAIGNADALRILKKLLAHSSEEVRIEAIISSAKAGRDDLLPKIKILANQHSYGQQEACACAFGLLKDESAIPFLKNFAMSPIPQVRLAALQALYRLGITQAQDGIKDLAFKGDLFAVVALGEMPNNQDALAQLAQSQNFQVRINAVIGLLKQSDPRCQPFLDAILIRDSRDLAFKKITSPGKALFCWKAMPSARQNYEDFSLDSELSQHFRESILSEAASLPEDCFYQVVGSIFDKQQNDLVPAAIALLEEQHTERSILFLKSYQQLAGAPLIRNYCNLALYRMHEEGPYGENLRRWVEQQANEQIIQLRPFIPWEVDSSLANYKIMPHETSRLLIEAFEAFAQRQDDAGINALLNAVRTGSSKNKYALAGLLMRASL